MSIALADLVGAAQFLVVVVVDAKRFADVIDPILIGCRIVAAGCFVSDGVGVVPPRIDITAGEGRTCFGVLAQQLLEFLPARADGCDQPVVGRRLSGIIVGFDVDELAALAGERRRQGALLSL